MGRPSCNLHAYIYIYIKQLLKMGAEICKAAIVAHSSIHVT